MLKKIRKLIKKEESPNSRTARDTLLEGQHQSHRPGRKTLREMYQTIGDQLTAIELDYGRSGILSFAAFRDFREGVVFLPVEILEGYLEDLLDLSVTNESLFLTPKRWRNCLQQNCQAPLVSRHILPSLVSICGMLGAGAFGLLLAADGASLALSTLAFVLTSTPFAWSLHLIPQTAMGRRVRFARVLLKEIFRRRGYHDDGSASTLLPTREPRRRILGEPANAFSMGGTQVQYVRIVNRTSTETPPKKIIH